MTPTAKLQSGKDDIVKKKVEGSKEQVAPGPLAITRLGLMALRSGPRGKQEERSYRLPVFYSGTTTAATTYTTVIPMSPSDSTEFSAIQALYDELITDAIDVLFVFGTEVAFTTQAPAIWGIAYDPISSAALSSTAGIVQHSQHKVWGMGTGTSAFETTPRCTNGDALFRWRIVVPRGDARSTASTAIFGHSWSSTSDTGDIYGYLKPYWKSIGATGTIGFEMIVTYHVRVRCRT